MKYRKYKFCFILTVLCLGLFSTNVFASDVYNFTIHNDVATFISESNTTANIDEEKRQITLPKLPLPDVIKFTREGTTDYAVLTKDGLKQYLFDGQKEVLVNSLSIPITDPLSMALTQDPNGYNNYSIVQMNPVDKTYDIKNYLFDGSTYVENPILNISGLQSVYSLSKTYSRIAVLTGEDVKLFDQTDNDMVEIPQLGIHEIKDPIALAASSEGYNVAILKKDKAEYYKFDGTSMMNIPALSVAVDPLKKPKAITIKDNSVSILYDKQINTYQLNAATNTMEYHAMLSITNGLVKPVAFDFRKDANDIVVIDEVDSVNKKYTAKYFMFDGSKMAEIEALENDIPNVTTGDTYSQEAVVVSNVLMSESDYDFLRLRAYTETPKGTSITFYVANAGDDPASVNWQESWKIENIDGLTDGVVTKYVPIDNFGNKDYQVYGTPQEAYPTFNSKPSPVEGSYSDDELEVIDDEGNLGLEVPENHLMNLWTKMPAKDKKIRFKAVLRTNDSEVTPMIFAPIGTNNKDGIVNADEMAIRIDTDAQPEPPILDPIDSDNADPTVYPPQDGWVYTTTPTIRWSFNDSDTSNDPEHMQIASQLLIFAKKDIGWELAYNSLKVDADEAGKLENFKIPTSDQPDKNGPLYQSGSYEFAIFVRTWDSLNIPSDFSTGVSFKVLAFERPRIANIVNSPSSIVPKLNDVSSHYMIKPNMTQAELPVTKAGAQVTLLLDSVGPIMADPTDIPKFYITVDGVDYEMSLGECKAVNSPGMTSNNRWTLNFWTNAPMTTIPNDTLVKAKFVGPGVIGGTTVLYVPTFADAIIKTSDTIYQDWIVTLQGSEK